MSTTIQLGDVPIAAGEIDAERAYAMLDRRIREAGALRKPLDLGAAILLFAIGGERLAVPLAAVAEVATLVPPTPAPGAPPALLGLIVRRGLIYNLVDIAPTLGLEGEGGAHMVLLRGPEPRIALRVDETLGVSHAPPGDLPDEDGLTATITAADGERAGIVAIARAIRAAGLRFGEKGE